MPLPLHYRERVGLIRQFSCRRILGRDSLVEISWLIQEPSHGLQAPSRRSIEGTAELVELLRRHPELVFLSDQLARCSKGIVQNELGERDVAKARGTGEECFLFRFHAQADVSFSCRGATRAWLAHCYDPLGYSNHSLPGFGWLYQFWEQVDRHVTPEHRFPGSPVNPSFNQLKATTAVSPRPEEAGAPGLLPEGLHSCRTSKLKGSRRRPRWKQVMEGPPVQFATYTHHPNENQIRQEVFFSC